MGDIGDNVNSNPNRKMMIVAIIAIIWIVLMLVAVWVWGSQGMAKIITGFFVLLFVTAFFFLLIILAIKMLFPPKVNMISLVNRRIMQGAQMQKPRVKTTVFLQGDEDYERKSLGQLNGICQGVIPAVIKRETKINEATGEVYTKKTELKPPIPIIFLSIKSGFMGKKVIAVHRRDISNPSMNEIRIKDVSLGLPFGNVYFPAKYAANSYVRMATVGKLVEDYTLEGVLKDFKTIVDDALQGNPAHQKGMEQKGVVQRIGELGEDQ